MQIRSKPLLILFIISWMDVAVLSKYQQTNIMNQLEEHISKGPSSLPPFYRGIHRQKKKLQGTIPKGLLQQEKQVKQQGLIPKGLQQQTKQQEGIIPKGLQQEGKHLRGKQQQVIVPKGLQQQQQSLSPKPQLQKKIKKTDVSSTSSHLRSLQTLNSLKDSFENLSFSSRMLATLDESLTSPVILKYLENSESVEVSHSQDRSKLNPNNQDSSESIGEVEIIGTIPIAKSKEDERALKSIEPILDISGPTKIGSRMTQQNPKKVSKNLTPKENNVNSVPNANTVTKVSSFIANSFVTQPKSQNEKSSLDGPLPPVPVVPPSATFPSPKKEASGLTQQHIFSIKIQPLEEDLLNADVLQLLSKQNEKKKSKLNTLSSKLSNLIPEKPKTVEDSEKNLIKIPQKNISNDEKNIPVDVIPNITEKLPFLNGKKQFKAYDNPVKTEMYRISFHKSKDTPEAENPKKLKLKIIS